MAVSPIRANEGPKPSQQQQAIEVRPVGAGTRLQFNGTSFASTRQALIQTFGKFPIRLNLRAHRQIVAGMEEVASANGGGQAPYTMILDSLSKFNDIELSEL